MFSSLHFSNLTNPNIFLLYALVMAVFFSLIKAKNSLVGQPLRFAAVCVGNTALVLLLAAWLFGLSIASKGEIEASINSEAWLEKHQHGAKLLAQYPSIEKLNIEGYGFEANQWHALEGIEVNFTPKHVAAGFANVNWPVKLNVAQKFDVTGTWLNPAKAMQVVNIELTDIAGAKVASTRVRSGEAFNLKAVAKAPGHFSYTLAAFDDDKKLIVEQPIYVHVDSVLLDGVNDSGEQNQISEIPLNILVMQSAPSFEVNQLKNWVGRYNTQMLIYTDISKARFITQSVNRPKQDLPKALSEQLLADTDMLIMDGRKLANLDETDMQMVSRAVEAGLGLLIFADSDFIANTPLWLQDFAFKAVTGNARDRKVLPVVNGKQSEVSFSVIAHDFSPLPGFKVLERGHQNRPLTVVKDFGVGKVAVSLLDTRYQWQQHQKPDMYSGAWQHLLKSISKVERQGAFIMSNTAPRPQIYFVNQQLEVCLLAKQQGSLQVIVNGQSLPLPLTQDIQQQSRYCTWYWPKQSGWHQFAFTSDKSTTDEGEGDKGLSFNQWRYVYAKDAWQTHQQNTRLQDTFKFIESNKLQPAREGASYYHQVNGLWYWWLLIVIAGLLWVERRQRG